MNFPNSAPTPSARVLSLLRNTVFHVNTTTLSLECCVHARALDEQTSQPTRERSNGRTDKTVADCSEHAIRSIAPSPAGRTMINFWALYNGRPVGGVRSNFMLVSRPRLACRRRASKRPAPIECLIKQSWSADWLAPRRGHRSAAAAVVLERRRRKVKNKLSYERRNETRTNSRRKSANSLID